MPRALLQLLLAILACAGPAAAQIDVALSPFPVLQYDTSIQPVAGYQTFGDGTGGVWAVFQGAQAGSALYAQHVLANGSFAARFTAAARAVTNSGTLVNHVAAAADGFGGALILWFGVNALDSTSHFVALRCQHLDPEGRNQYPDTGLVVSSIAQAALLLGDGQGGVYVAWEELKSVSNPDIVAQHYGYFGNPLWVPSGSPTGRNVCAVVGLQRLLALHDDGAGGAFVLWKDSRSASGNVPLYATRLNPTGVATAPWTANGVRITPITSGIRIVGSAPAPGGGLWLAWRDTGNQTQLLAQRIAPDASFTWPATGAIVATVSPERADFVAASLGDVFVTWGGDDIRSSRLNSSGARVWPELDGRVLVTPPVPTPNTRAATDGAGGQRFQWSFDNAGQSDMNIQQVDPNGAPSPGWPLLGQAFATTALSEEPVAWLRPETSAPGVTWLAGGALKVRLPSGAVGVGGGIAQSRVALAPPAPNPLRGRSLVLRFSAPAGPARMEMFDAAGRRVLTRALHSNGGQQEIPLEDLAWLAPGVYTLRLTAAGRSATQRLVRVD